MEKTLTLLREHCCSAWRVRLHRVERRVKKLTSKKAPVGECIVSDTRVDLSWLESVKSLIGECQVPGSEWWSEENEGSDWRVQKL